MESSSKKISFIIFTATFIIYDERRLQQRILQQRDGGQIDTQIDREKGKKGDNPPPKKKDGKSGTYKKKQ